MSRVNLLEPCPETIGARSGGPVRTSLSMSAFGNSLRVTLIPQASDVHEIEVALQRGEQAASFVPLSQNNELFRSRNNLIGHEHRQIHAVEEVTRNPTKQLFPEPGMAKRAGNQEVGA